MSWLWRGAFSIFLGLALGAASCRDASFVVLQVRSSLTIPDQADALGVTILTAAERASLVHWDLTLGAGQVFPLEVVLEPSERTPSRLEADVQALLGGTTVAHVEAVFEWRHGQTSTVSLPPLEPP